MEPADTSNYAQEVPVLGGFVRIDETMADDLSVVRSARVSFGKSAQTIGEAEIGLIKFLMRERHGTPFEHAVFRFHVKCPIFVAREWFRHRIGSFNEFSGRYSTMTEEFYVPELEDMRTQVGKPGSYTFEQMDKETARAVHDIMTQLNSAAFDGYNKLLDMGVAKEVARMVVPVSAYTQFYWTVNARALMNFLSLRTAETAQREIRDYADKIEAFFSAAMPVTYAAWVSNNKTTP